ncbi:MAG: OpcA, an allosteric effector of glucose-6-phosphate dehydrogenase, actinobacterial [uncultured Nocardioides sp.]|uniref:OpcA, an allosteric effector of glucose-6-phosphate dehydrogenase, actinobacterial n=1 Tax=uncultured Nocardioides sp. TaxID=198441 RepID=A0A6J4NV46_9ACTN|nr:MAG: OpcA, an allosteric effector of glucose-6-phosphate dehydrogenase, actinobacterial [uncultured Nocardioides sp.]
MTASGTIVLEETDAAGIASALLDARRDAGSPAMGMVMTLVIVVPDEDAEEALAAAREAAREHPSRLLAVVIGSGRGASAIRAEIRTGAGAVGEMALIRLSGEVTRHPESVVLPLLLPDSPVVVWWPTDAPDDPAGDPLGALASRRITDAAQARSRRTQALLVQCASYAEGNTDLAWTRLTPWRALLAAAMDQVDVRVSGISISAERVSPSADLLGAGLADRLRAPLERHRSQGPGITDVTLTTRRGDISVTRPDGRLATLSVPGAPDRPVALRRRDIPELLAEELRRLDPDDIYAATVKRLTRMNAEEGSAADAGKPAKKPDKKPASKPAGKPGDTAARRRSAGEQSGGNTEGPS